MKYNKDRSIVTGKVRLRYMNLFEPKFNEWKKKDLYSCQILIDKNDKETLSKINNAVKAAANDKFQNHYELSKIKTTLRDGDKKEDLPETAEVGDEPFKGHYFISVSNGTKPVVVGRDVRTKMSPFDIKDGDYFKVALNASAYDYIDKGVTFYLGNVQFIESGEPLSGQVEPANQFESYLSEEDIFG